jgi:hypothetical protein
MTVICCYCKKVIIAGGGPVSQGCCHECQIKELAKLKGGWLCGANAMVEIWLSVPKTSEPFRSVVSWNAPVSHIATPTEIGTNSMEQNLRDELRRWARRFRDSNTDSCMSINQLIRLKHDFASHYGYQRLHEVVNEVEIQTAQEMLLERLPVTAYRQNQERRKHYVRKQNLHLPRLRKMCRRAWHHVLLLRWSLACRHGDQNVSDTS